jgi:Rod binding domain-containing protein
MMDNTALIFNEGISPLAPGKQLEKLDQAGMSEEKKKQIAKDFESLLINKLLDEMKNTVGDWGFEKDGASMQVQGIFWLYLARDIANNGGIGLWKDIYKSMTNNEPVNSAVKSTDKFL